MQVKELTIEDVKNDNEYWYFYNLLKNDYIARVDTEYAVRQYFIEKHGTTDLRAMGKNGIPHYQLALRKMYRVKSVFHCCQPTDDDKRRMEQEQEKFKEINNDSVVKVFQEPITLL